MLASSRLIPFSRCVRVPRSACSARFIMSFSSPNDVVIVAASRTPVGSFNGALKSLTAPQLGVMALKHALNTSKVAASEIEEVLFGNVIQAGVGQSPARQVALGAGLKESTDATTINKVCASGMKAVMFAAQSIQLGHKSVVAAGGMESMSNAPFLLQRTPPPYGHYQAKDSLINDGLWDVYNNVHMGNCAESAAKKHAISREDQDAHAIESYRRAERAWKSGAFDAEIAEVTVTSKKGDVVVREDEEYKNIKYDKVPTLKPTFQKENGTVTPANSSPLNDGASALILMSSAKAAELGVKPLARIVSYADAAMAPIDFPIAPTIALPLALEKAGLKASDISLFEINEAFSMVVRVAEKVLQLDPTKINVNGGAVSLGHAIGNSGSRIIVSLVHALRQGQYGAAGICNGGGAASAIVIQKL
ncbi:thiolase [Gautieria morchelliformis]|nr:thiolase [Gautieria morchelliformis]